MTKGADVNIQSTKSLVKVTTSVRQYFIREIEYNGINVQERKKKHNVVLLESSTSNYAHFLNRQAKHG